MLSATVALAVWAMPSYAETYGQNQELVLEYENLSSDISAGSGDMVLFGGDNQYSAKRARKGRDDKGRKGGGGKGGGGKGGSGKGGGGGSSR